MSGFAIQQSICVFSWRGWVVLRAHLGKSWVIVLVAVKALVLDAVQHQQGTDSVVRVGAYMTVACHVIDWVGLSAQVGTQTGHREETVAYLRF